MVFTDGACSNNGASIAKAGCGVYFPNNEFEFNLSNIFILINSN